MRFSRSCGLLLHVSSLPGDHGAGDIGPVARWFVDALQRAGQSWWQVLPLGPSDRGHPYLAQSSWAGSPLLVSLDDLVETGELRADEVAAAALPHGALIDVDAVVARRMPLLRRAARRFREREGSPEWRRFEEFCARERAWLDDWALFAAARDRHGGAPWWRWPRELALREPGAVDRWRAELAAGVREAQIVQFWFARQWRRLRRHARERGVRLLGDLPIYCARDSADVWAARHLFRLDEGGAPRAVSGVPPDVYAADGQLWGSPLYDWERHAADGFSWWIARLRGVLGLVDAVRIDHFRAFQAYWEVPAGAETAREGRWVPGPGDAFFAAVRDALGDAPLIAEDLGIITRAVDDLRRRWGLPGMKVLQFAWGQGAASPHLPIHHERSAVVYTATHDNDTTVGWYQRAPEGERDLFRRYTCSDGSAPHYHMIVTAFRSVADLAIVPVQDVLGFGSDTRLNTPGVAEGSWRWRLTPGQLHDGALDMMRDLASLYGRAPGQRVAELLDDTGVGDADDPGPEGSPGGHHRS